ncbi:hypothetical protein O3M35_000239 [Rhynocoris fuscipes]|uniref:Uncharacterized protein n=1 Tax=Rhynocoris fuscipes TaxID=488301 RepID=A0AAW1DPG9_9HEMI
MPIDYRELLKAAEVVAEKEEMKVTVKYSLCGAAFVACAAVLGGIAAGPRGIHVGAAIGGVLALSYFKGKFKSVVSIIQEDLSESQKQKLAEHLERALRDFQITDFAKIVILLRSNEALYMEILKALKFFLENDMKLHVSQ